MSGLVRAEMGRGCLDGGEGHGDLEAAKPLPEDGFAALVERCVPAIFSTVPASLPRAAAVIVGHSLGGQLGLIASARFAPELPVVLAASGSAGHRGFPGWRRWAALGGSRAIGRVGRVLGYWPGDRLGFGGPQPAAVMRDWSYTVRTGRFRAATWSFDYATVLREYRGEVLAISVDQDVLAPHTATETILAMAACTGSWHRAGDDERDLDMRRLRADLATGEWQRRWGHLLGLRELDLGYRVVVARP
jgi:predicted alpha/beta hydrolase